MSLTFCEREDRSTDCCASADMKRELASMKHRHAMLTHVANVAISMLLQLTDPISTADSDTTSQSTGQGRDRAASTSTMASSMSGTSSPLPEVRPLRTTRPPVEETVSTPIAKSPPRANVGPTGGK